MICSDCGQDWRGGHVCEVDHLKEMLAQARKLESGINKSACLLMAGGEKLLAERDQLLAVQKVSVKVIEGLRAEILGLKAYRYEDACAICAGEAKTPKGDPCVCKDGTATGEAQALRERLYAVNLQTGELKELATLALENLEDDIESKAMRHSCGNLIARLRAALGISAITRI